MSRRKQPLPEYGSLIRWTVQEVINWLAENSLSECNKCFREGGVDGNKLVNVTETDLVNIKCPRKHIKEIIHHVSKVERPGFPSRTGGFGTNQRQQPFNSVNHMLDDGSDSDVGWDEDEFSDVDEDSGSDGPGPVAPPRPNRRDPPQIPRAAAPPPVASHRHAPVPLPSEPAVEEEFYEEPEDTGVPEVRGRPPLSNVRGRPPLPVPSEDSPDEDYENPDANIKVQNFHGGPLPTLPPQGKKPVPIGQRKPPPIKQEESNSEPEEEYEDPDQTVAMTGPPIPPGARRPLPPPIASVPRSHIVVPEEPSEEYEDPDVTMATPIAPMSTPQRKPRPPPVTSVPTTHTARKKLPVPEEEYEEPEQSVAVDQKKPQPPPLSKLPSKKAKAWAHSSDLPAFEMSEEEKAPPRVPRYVPKKKHPEPKFQPEETYEVPDETDSTPSRTAPQRFQKALPQYEEETYEVPDKEEDVEQDDYLDMDPDSVEPPNSYLPDYLDITDENIGLPAKQDMALGGNRRQPANLPRGKMPLPNESKSRPGKMVPERKVPLEPQETYEIPDEKPVKASPRKRIGVSVLPGMNNQMISNGVKENTISQHTKSGRALPPPPTVSQERVEPVRTEPKNEPAKPASHPKEMTEADLLRQKWYHGNIKRIDAEVKLKQLNIDGMYLIRKSSQGSDQPYTLQIFYKSKVYNLPIRRRPDNLFAVGKEEKDNEKAFVSLLDLVNGFKQNILVLSGGAETKLVKSLPKT